MVGARDPRRPGSYCYACEYIKIIIYVNCLTFGHFFSISSFDELENKLIKIDK